jgi:hypothetical protein
MQFSTGNMQPRIQLFLYMRENLNNRSYRSETETCMWTAEPKIIHDSKTQGSVHIYLHYIRETELASTVSIDARINRELHKANKKHWLLHVQLTDSLIDVKVDIVTKVLSLVALYIVMCRHIPTNIYLLLQFHFWVATNTCAHHIPFVIIISLISLSQNVILALFYVLRWWRVVVLRAREAAKEEKNRWERTIWNMLNLIKSNLTYVMIWEHSFNYKPLSSPCLSVF